MELITLNYSDLISDVDLSHLLLQAFGKDGSGILLVKGAPKLETLRARLLPLSRKFALLPESSKTPFEHPELFYCHGWSHGKEKLQGHPDLAKGTFYSNVFNRNVLPSDELLQHYNYQPNVWPCDEIPDYGEATLSLTELIVSIGHLILKQCDSCVAKQCNAYPSTRVGSLMSKSYIHKAR